MEVRQSEKSPEIVTELVPLKRLLLRLEQGRIRIPRFQRPFVWKPKQMLDLLDSVRRHYPIGSIILWDSETERESLDKIGPVSIEGKASESGTFSYVLDGFQRLSTLAGALLTNEVSEWIWNIGFDLHTEQFYHIRRRTNLSRTSIQVSRLLKTAEFLAEARRIKTLTTANDLRDTDFLLKKAEDLALAFSEYQVPIIRIRQSSLTTAVQIFSRLNSSGRAISGDQMISALTYRRGRFNFSNELDSLTEELATIGFGGLSRNTLLRTVLAATGTDIYNNDWIAILGSNDLGAAVDRPIYLQETKLNLPGLITAATAIKKSTKLAIDFLKQELVYRDCLLPYSLQFVFLSEFFRICPAPTSSQENELRRWFWLTSLTGHFASFSSDNARSSLQEIRRLATREANELVLPENIATPVPNTFNSQNARIRAYLIFLLYLKPASFSTFKEIPVDAELSSHGLRSFRKLIEGGYETMLVDSAVNRAFLTPDDTGIWKVLSSDFTNPIIRQTSESHGITPRAIEALNGGDIDRFFKLRGDFLQQEEARFIASRGVHPPGKNSSEETLNDSDEIEDWPQF